MDELSILAEMLKGNLSPNEASIRLQEIYAESSSHSKLLPLIRTANCLRDGQFIDFLGNLRQSICYYPKSFEVCKNVKRIVSENAKAFQILLGGSNGSYLGINNLISERPDLKSVFLFETRKSNKESLGDGTLWNCFNYSSYRSLSQKMMMYFIKNMQKNETLLACLPTGGGKSLSWELPVKSRMITGMVIVIVPTIGLAEDHKNSSQDIFEDDLSGKYIEAYNGSFSEEERIRLLADIENGKISILYISPEALISNRFQESVLSAARKGMVDMLVVDEAHLISQWGMKFRPEFQLISTFRNKLEKESVSGIKTVLLSATLNPEDTRVIKKVFSSDNFTEYRADELRPEPSYYVHECHDDQERIDIVKELCCKAPRPIIVYSATPEQAEQYYEAVKGIGFKRLAVFTGNTETEKRSSLIEQWRENDIDIMFATSAFGMGINKPDVRTIITGYIPENISRFYQEVGRAGRDGYASLNYWLPLKDDWNTVNDLTKSAILRNDTIINRWFALLEEGEKATSDKYWLNISAATDELRYRFTGEMHRGWNKDVILFMLRVGLIEILEVCNDGKDEYRILVHLLDTDSLSNKDKLSEVTAPYREKERKQVDSGKKAVKYLIDNTDTCIADKLKEEFPFAARQCYGCPACRRREAEPYSENGEITATLSKENLHTRLIPNSDDEITQALVFDRKSVFLYSSNRLTNIQIAGVIQKLIRKGVNVFVIPNSFKAEHIKNIQGGNKTNYILLYEDELYTLKKEWLNGVCAFFLPDGRNGQQLFSYAEKYIKNSNNQAIFIAPSDYYIHTQNKELSEISDVNISIDVIS